MPICTPLLTANLHLTLLISYAKYTGSKDYNWFRMYTPEFILAVGEDESTGRPFGLVPLSVIYNMQFDGYVAACMLENLAKDDKRLTTALHGKV